MTALMFALFLFGSHGPKVQRYSVKPWVLTVTQDRFTGAKTCTAKARGVRLDGERLTFDLGRYVENTEAVYRLDDGAAQKLSALPSDAGYRESFHFDPARDGHLAFFAVADVAGVHKLSIRAADKGPVASFDLSALPKLLDGEKGAGCPGF